MPPKLPVIMGIDPAGGADIGAVSRFWQFPSGRLCYIPDYIPDAWLDRIQPFFDEKGKVHFLWTGWNNGQGHGKVRVNGKARYVYREVVERVTGRKLARFDYVDHLCTRKGCINFDCLEPVTPKVNTERGPGAQTQFKPATAFLTTTPHWDADWLRRIWMREPLDGL